MRARTSVVGLLLVAGLTACGDDPTPSASDEAATTPSAAATPGAAVSVALGQVNFALGTDTGGSIRVPAAWCGVVGYKPTKDHPAWSTEGVLPLSWTCDHAGPLAQDVRTVVRVHEALTGRDKGDARANILTDLA